jgi:hypothetical protein
MQRTAASSKIRNSRAHRWIQHLNRVALLRRFVERMVDLYVIQLFIPSRADTRTPSLSNFLFGRCNAVMYRLQDSIVALGSIYLRIGGNLAIACTTLAN